MRGFLRMAAMALLAAFVTASAYLAGFAVQFTLSPPPMESSATALEDQFEVFWEAWGIIQQEFYGDVPSPQRMTYAAIQGVVDTLGDPHTVFVDAAHAAILNDDLSGAFEGIGAVVEMRDGQLVIVSPLKDTPAQRAGLRAGDVVMAIDGRPTEGLSLFEAISLIRGRKGTIVRLTIHRPEAGEPLTLEIVRDRIELPVVESEMLEGDTAYLKLFSFNGRATPAVKSALQQLLAQEPRGLILDLRDNPGGFLHVAVEVASQFVNEGLILTEVGRDGVEREHPALKGGLATDIPLAVLVNKGTASAAEIVAGAIQDHGRGVLIGEGTFGKGSVQVTHELSDNSSLRVTTARWFTPSGHQIHGQGLRPDIEVVLTEEDRANDRDPQLERAVEYIRRW
ncbi:MAG: S41 family peptidase [Anaerolineae bacterium]